MKTMRKQTDRGHFSAAQVTHDRAPTKRNTNPNFRRPSAVEARTLRRARGHPAQRVGVSVPLSLACDTSPPVPARQLLLVRFAKLEQRVGPAFVACPKGSKARRGPLRLIQFAQAQIA